MKIEEARYVRSALSQDDFPRDGLPEVAFAGRSNVGKSSLLNRLLGRKVLARISSDPGRTRAVNYFLVNSRFYFVDLPGYGYAKVGKKERESWAALVESYLRWSAPRAGVVLLVDAKVGATPRDREAYVYLKNLAPLIAVVATKADRLSRGRWPEARQKIRSSLDLEKKSEPIFFSARSGEGVKALWREIAKHLQSSAKREQQARLRHGQHGTG